MSRVALLHYKVVLTMELYSLQFISLYIGQYAHEYTYIYTHKYVHVNST